MDGFYNLNAITNHLNSEGEQQFNDASNELKEVNRKLELLRNKIYTTQRDILLNNRYYDMNEHKDRDDFLNALENKEEELIKEKDNGSHIENLSDKINNRLSQFIYAVIKEDEDDEKIKDDKVLLPYISDELKDLFGEIFIDGIGDVNDNCDYSDLMDFKVSDDKATTLYICIRDQKAEENILEDDEEEETEEDEGNSWGWEQNSIDENENPDKSDASSESSDLSDSEDDDEPEKVDECKRCIDYSYLINQMRIKDEKIENLNEIIKIQDKQIEEYEEKEENKRDISYEELQEEYEQLKNKMQIEKDENNKILKSYMISMNLMIDEIRELRKQKNETLENI